MTPGAAPHVFQKVWAAHFEACQQPTWRTSSWLEIDSMCQPTLPNTIWEKLKISGLPKPSHFLTKNDRFGAFSCEIRKFWIFDKKHPRIPTNTCSKILHDDARCGSSCFQKVWGSSFRNLMGQIDLRVDPPRDRFTESEDPVVLGKPKIRIRIPDAAPHVFLNI